jgi:predicted nucleic acid-binding protein
LTYKAVFEARDLSRFAKPLEYRKDRELPFDAAQAAQGELLVLDTCTVIDGLKNTLPPEIAMAISGGVAISSAVVVGELVRGHASLKPSHPMTARNAATIMEAIQEAEALPTCLTPSPHQWVEANAVVATIGRCNGIAKEMRDRLLADALIYISARDAGARLVTANIADFDLIDRVATGARLLFYRPTIAP